MGKTKHKKISILLIMTIMMLAFSSLAYAVHDAIVTLTPDITNCDALGNTFTVNIENDINTPSADDILQVEIYKALAGLSNFICGDAPSGWSYLPWPSEDRCIYVTGLNSADKIAPGQNLSFTFDAIMSSNSCDSSFTIVTVDDAFPSGDRDTTIKQVLIDCTDPVILKTVGTPKVPGTELFDWWVRQSTLFDVLATDTQNKCDLGVDYCEWRYTLDNDAPQLWTRVNNTNLEVNFDFSYGEDSEHFLEIRCFDLAGNEVTHNQTDKVDDTPPVTTKIISEPKKVLNGVEWIDSVTEITLEAVDPDPTQQQCNISVDETYYRITQVDDAYCLGELACEPLQGELAFQLPDFNIYDGPISDIPESCHLMEYYSEDLIGNVEATKTNCFFVDKTPPEAEKWIGEPAIIEISALADDEEMYVVKIINPTGSDISTEVVFEGLISAWAGVSNADVAFAFSEDISYYFDPFWGSCNGLNGAGCGPDFVGQTWEEWLIAHPDWMDWASTETGTAYPGGDEYLVISWVDGQIISPQIIPANSEVWGIIRLKFKTADTFRFSLKSDSDLEIYHGAMPEEYIIWAQDHVTPVELTCTDQEPHPSGDAEVCYKVGLDGSDDTLAYCDGTLEKVTDTGYEGDWCCVPDSKTIIFGEDSNHDLEYFCRDAVNKKSGIDLEYFKVDSVPPVITKTMLGTKGIDYRGDCPPNPNSNTDVCYVADNGVGGVHVEVVDPDPTGMSCNVGEVRCGYTLWWNATKQECNAASANYNYHADSKLCEVGTGQFSDATDVLFHEDSTHFLTINCYDALDNHVSETEKFLVDSTPPVTTKTYGEPHYPDDINVPGPYPHWITTQTPITLNATDNKVGVDQTFWRYIVVDNKWCQSEASGCQNYDAAINEPFIPYADAVTLPEESCHLIEFYSVDLLGNGEGINRQCVFVDNTAPDVWKDVGGPQVVKGDDLFITQQTPIDLYCQDVGDHPVDHVKLFYKTRFAKDCAELPNTEWGDTQDYMYGEPNNHVTNGDNPYLLWYRLFFEQDSCHELEYWCEDGLGTVAGPYNEIDIVDTQAPVIDVTVVGPQEGDCPAGEDEVCYVDGVTEIHVDATDPEPHPVNDVFCDWRYDIYEGDSWVGEKINGTPITPPFVITFPEESRHELAITCWDALNNQNTRYERFYVDHSSPDIDKEYVWPYYEEGGVEWITSETTAVITLNDPAPHPSGVDSAEYRVSIVNDSYCFDQRLCYFEAEGDGSFTTPTLETVMAVDYNGDVMICDVDDVNKYNTIMDADLVEDYLAQNPEDYLGQCEADGEQDSNGKIAYCHNDHGTGSFVHKVSGAGGANNHVGQTNDPMHLGDHFGPCTVKQFDFTIDEESCHLIEINATDNVDKESMHKQCVFVDNTPPEPVKTVGTPRSVINHTETYDDYYFQYYPDVNGRCWNESSGDPIDCWKVTLLTPVNLECEDVGPHPVDHNTICYKYDLDGDDITQDKCVEGNGVYNVSDGFCCVNSEWQGFTFGEVSEHNLAYYCVDALGNKGETDDEKFKVEETSFEIQLNKKWNLISVPVKLLDDSMDIVFSDIADKVISVWAFDGTNWFSYFPDAEPGVNDLTTMKPGWGYWILMKEDAMLEIGGSLFSPAMSPPEVPVLNGWNLLGYYGAEGLPGYYGPAGAGKPAYCALYSIGDSVFDKGFASLWTYWELLNPNMWKALSGFDGMDPGAGYWVFATEGGLYVPTTTCGPIGPFPV